jgi:hypothetical protein
MTSDMMVGTPHYMSPEQVQGGHIDGRSDLFSLGVVLYEAVTGKKPFEAPSLAAILNRILSGKVAAPHEVDPQVPERLSAIVMRAMAREPGERYARGRELAAELRGFLGELRGEAPAAAEPAARKGSGVFTGIAALILAVAIGTGAWYVGSGGPPPAEPTKKGFVHLTSDVPGVEIYHDGKLIGLTPYTWEAPVGKHDLEFRKEGYFPSEQTVTVEADKRNPFEISMYAR